MFNGKKMKLSIPPDTKLYELFYDFYEKINKNRKKKITKKEALDMLGWFLAKIEIKIDEKKFENRFF